jgi:hypothetical protein
MNAYPGASLIGYALCDVLALVAPRGWKHLEIVCDVTEEGDIQMQHIAALGGESHRRPGLGLESAGRRALDVLLTQLRYFAAEWGVGWSGSSLSAGVGAEGVTFQLFPGRNADLVGRPPSTWRAALCSFTLPSEQRAEVTFTDEVLDALGDAEAEIVRRTRLSRSLGEIESWTYDRRSARVLLRGSGREQSHPTQLVAVHRAAGDAIPRLIWGWDVEPEAWVRELPRVRERWAGRAGFAGFLHSPRVCVVEDLVLPLAWLVALELDAQAVLRLESDADVFYVAVLAEPKAPAPPLGPIRAHLVRGRVVLLLPRGRFERSVAEAAGKRSLAFLSPNDCIDGAVRERIEEAGFGYVAEIDALGEFFLGDLPLDAERFEAARTELAPGVEGVEARLPRVGTLIVARAGSGWAVTTEPAEHVRGWLEALAEGLVATP